ncbi:hypothetical protein [Sanyastnella coralliicola]|uniref:hypothetical protein n=1 Tax=Sanyastnella coralliicola TaxID=3069118 RepID=UPI0027BAE0AE|nr:hypothetical protein [Longitalea sp. SCSIO 12813]
MKKRNFGGYTVEAVEDSIEFKRPISASRFVFGLIIICSLFILLILCSNSITVMILIGLFTMLFAWNSYSWKKHILNRNGSLKTSDVFLLFTYRNTVTKYGEDWTIEIVDNHSYSSGVVKKDGYILLLTIDPDNSEPIMKVKRQDSALKLVADIREWKEKNQN